MSRKKVRELESRCDFLIREVADQQDRIASLRCELDRVSRCKKEAEDTLAEVESDLEKYKGLYADEMQKRPELAEMARKLEEENRRLRGELAEVLGDG